MRWDNQQVRFELMRPKVSRMEISANQNLTDALKKDNNDEHEGEHYRAIPLGDQLPGL
jgi:hypothetical protein